VYLCNRDQTFTRIHSSENLQIPTTCEWHRQALVDWSQRCLQRSASVAASSELDCSVTLAHRHVWHNNRYSGNYQRHQKKRLQRSKVLKNVTEDEKPIFSFASTQPPESIISTNCAITQMTASTVSGFYPYTLLAQLAPSEKWGGVLIRS